MDKSIINNDKNKHKKYEVHAIPKGETSFHRKYGLWICKYGRGVKSAPYSLSSPRRYFEFFCISHLFKGDGWYWNKKAGLRYLNEGECIINTVGCIHGYGGNTDFYTEDTICFIGSIAEKLFQLGIICDGIFVLGKLRRLLPIIEYAEDPSRDSQIKANIALQNLLIDIYLENKGRKKDKTTSCIEKLADEIKNNLQKWWTVNEMAEFCGLSEAHFRRVFHSSAGSSPKDYIDKLKIQKAAELLCCSDKKVGDVALQFGYMDPFHFSRRFKQLTGFSPDAYRRQMSR